VLTDADVNSLIPLYAIGVFIGFTLSQFGLVRHWRRERPRRWRQRAALNGAGMVMTALAAVVFLVSKFLEGAWAVTIAIPVLMLGFAHTERYYAVVARHLKLGRTPPHPRRRESVVVVPTSTVNLLTEHALSAALSMGETVVALAVAGDEQERAAITREWDQWDPGVPLEVVIDEHRSLIRTVLRYIESVEERDKLTLTVLIPEIQPDLRVHEIMHNQRGRLLEAALRGRTDVVIATLPFHVHEDRELRRHGGGGNR
jgi:hypothetical protein